MDRYSQGRICPACYRRNTGIGFCDGHYLSLCYDRDCGLVSMIDRTTTQRYDRQYVAERYDRYPTTERMSALRATLVETLTLLHDSLPEGLTVTKKGRLLDVGYGNGSFIRECLKRGWSAFGNDVNPTPYPQVNQVPLPTTPLSAKERYRVITFFDALEHFESLDTVSKVAQNTDWIICSFPRLPDDFPEQLAGWKHFRPGEHHYFFTPQSLARLFSDPHYAAVIEYVGHPEDWIRGKSATGESNITTVALRMQERVHTCASSGTGGANTHGA